MTRPSNDSSQSTYARRRGREDKTVADYRRLHLRWFSPDIGPLRVRQVDSAAIDRVFGKMRQAGLSRSRMNHARSLYAPFFRWARKRGMTLQNPMVDFQLPTSKHVARERTPPEVEELCVLLTQAALLIPDVAPVLVLGAVTGMRRGELAGVRRSHIDWTRSRLTVGTAIDGQHVKATKTRTERHFFIDADSLAMLERVCAEQEALAERAGVELVDDPFVFTLTVDGSKPMPPGHMTKRVAVLRCPATSPQPAARPSRNDATWRTRRARASDARNILLEPVRSDPSPSSEPAAHAPIGSRVAHVWLT